MLPADPILAYFTGNERLSRGVSCCPPIHSHFVSLGQFVHWTSGKHLL